MGKVTSSSQGIAMGNMPHIPTLTTGTITICILLGIPLQVIIMMTR
jgi:hypothetical protein|tara:strand:- start:27 stop:164 length:138 start_codon:yes stop_codon:yes gene_type:complete